MTGRNRSLILRIYVRSRRIFRRDIRQRIGRFRIASRIVGNGIDDNVFIRLHGFKIPNVFVIG